MAQKIQNVLPFDSGGAKNLGWEGKIGNKKINQY